MPHPLHILINDFALRSLRETADKDYLHARLAYRSQLIPQFLWSSLHCLEKYTKCILVLNRVDARKIKHEIAAGLAKLENQGKFQIDLSETAAKFVKKLEDGARFRYYETSYFSEELDLPYLDRAVWELRRYCQPLDYDLEVDGRQVNQLTAHLMRIRAAQETGEKGSCLMGGWLEGVLEKQTSAAREALIWQNLYFGRNSRKTVRIQNYFEAGNSPLFLHPEIVDEVSKYIFLPEEVKSAYRALHADRLTGNSDA